MEKEATVEAGKEKEVVEEVTDEEVAVMEVKERRMGNVGPLCIQENVGGFKLATLTLISKELHLPKNNQNISRLSSNKSCKGHP